MTTKYKPVQIITLDEKQKARIVYAQVDDKPHLHQAVRYIFDSACCPEKFYVYETSSDRAIKLTDAARILKVNNLTCHSPYIMMLVLAPAELGKMTDDQISYLTHCWDYESLKLRLVDGKVHLVDTITEDSYNIMPPEKFVQETLKYVEEDL